MEALTVLKGIAAPMNLENVDTDKILPARFLKTIKRTGLGVHLFESLRYDSDGRERPNFVLNRPGYRQAKFLIAGSNFGCGSSREHAPWALLDFGIRCIIAPSFADIFCNNCYKNGLLPVTLARNVCETLLQNAHSIPTSILTLDLACQTIVGSDGTNITFECDAFRRHCLLNGLDEIGLTLQQVKLIDDYETRMQAEQVWQPRIRDV